MMSEPDLRRMRESVEQLTGERGKNPSIRRNDLKPIASFGLKSSQVSAAPTAAQYNALQDDVKAIYDTLVRLSNLYGTSK